MKRTSQIITALVVNMALVLGSWGPAMALTSLTLDRVTASAGGVALHFTFDGNISKDEMTGHVTTESGDEYPIYCVKRDDHTLRCTTSKKVAGESLTVFLAGHVFYASAPNLPLSSGPSGPSCPQDGLIQIGVTFELSDSSFASFVALGPVTANVPIDLNAFVNSMIQVFEIIYAPLTVVSWTLDSVQCW